MKSLVLLSRSAVLFSVSVALQAMISVPGSQAGPIPITECQHIIQSGSYVLANNLPGASGLLADGNCISLDAGNDLPNGSSFTIDLAGFVISGDGKGTGILQGEEGLGSFVVRNGSIANFSVGVEIQEGSGAVEGLRVFNNASGGIRISKTSGIVKGNILSNNKGPGIEVGEGSTVSGNTAVGNSGGGISAGIGSTLIGNTAAGNGSFGISAHCPSNLTDNTAVNNGTNLVLNGAGCHNEDNVAP
jgi:parallel beta-helix repeat protein